MVKLVQVHIQVNSMVPKISQKKCVLMSELKQEEEGGILFMLVEAVLVRGQPRRRSIVFCVLQN